VLALVGAKVWYRTVGRGEFHCERCGGDRPYLHRSGRRGAHVLGIPVASLSSTGEHLRCTVCRTCYRVELLAVPTMAQMLVALQAGTTAAVLEMLKAGAAGPAARRCGIEMIRAGGALDVHDGWLVAALADLGSAGPNAADLPQDADGAAVSLRPAIEALAIQLDIYAREWFLAKVVQVGLADGPLTAAQRSVAGNVARHLGMTASRGEDVISLVEEAA
jgi:hypothetical protein